MIVIIRTIMKDYRNFSWYFISEIAHIISCSSKYSCVMTVMSNFCMPSNFIFIEFFFAGMTTFCFLYLLSCLFVNSIISFCSQLIGLVTWFFRFPENISCDQHFRSLAKIMFRFTTQVWKKRSISFQYKLL